MAQVPMRTSDHGSIELWRGPYWNFAYWTGSRLQLTGMLISIFIILRPEGHSAMDKALPWHTGGRGSNSDTTKVYSAPTLSGTHAMCTLSLSHTHNACHHMLQREFLSRRR